MKKKNQKLVALALAMSMMLGTALPAYAADKEQGTSSGTGAVEGVISTDVFSVVVPTESTSAFNFILDPQGLIAATVTDDSSSYNGKTFESDKTLFFPNADDATIEYTKTNDYSSSSNPLEIMNKSTMEVNVSLSATVDASSLVVGEGATAKSAKLAADDTFKVKVQGEEGEESVDSTEALIYLALVNTTESKTEVITDQGATIKATLDGAADGVYKTQLVGGEYKYAIDEEVVPSDADHAALAAKFDTVQFKLTGACNPKGDWTGLADLAPKVSVTWKVRANTGPGVENVTGEYANVNTITTDLTTDIFFPDGCTNITNIKYKLNGATTATAMTANTHYTVSGETLTLKATLLKLVYPKGSAECTVTFGDGTTATFTITLTVPSSDG